MRPRCKVTGKLCYTDREEAEIAADTMALRNWHNGQDTDMAVYLCQHCGGFLHVGTRTKRPVHPWKTPLHPYKHLPNPRPCVQSPVHAGNFTNLEKTYEPRKHAYQSRPRRNKSPRPYPCPR